MKSWCTLVLGLFMGWRPDGARGTVRKSLVSRFFDLIDAGHAGEAATCATITRVLM